MTSRAVIAVGIGERIDTSVHPEYDGLHRFDIDVGIKGRRDGLAVSFPVVTRHSKNIIPFLRDCASGRYGVQMVHTETEGWCLNFVRSNRLYLSVPLGVMSEEDALQTSENVLAALRSAPGIHYYTDSTTGMEAPLPC